MPSLLFPVISFIKSLADDIVCSSGLAAAAVHSLRQLLKTIVQVRLQNFLIATISWRRRWPYIYRRYHNTETVATKVKVICCLLQTVFSTWQLPSLPAFSCHTNKPVDWLIEDTPCYVLLILRLRRQFVLCGVIVLHLVEKLVVDLLLQITNFYAQQHIVLSAHYLWQFRQSVSVNGLVYISLLSSQGQTDRHTHTDRQTQTDFIICPMLHVIAMGQIKKMLARKN